MRRFEPEAVVPSLITAAAVAALATAVVAVAACGRRANRAPEKAEHTVVWRQLGSWSGRGSLQTESFTSDTGTLRVRWETSSTSNAGSTAGSAGPGAAATASAAQGLFRLTAHSAISGRPLQEVVEHAGAGRGEGYVQQDPHVFYVVVESSQLNWRFTVEEAIGYP